MKDLAGTYDVDTPFEDEALIDEIVEKTFPGIREFFTRHVEGNEPIDYVELLARVGLTMGEQEAPSGYFLKDLQSQIPFIDVDPSDTDIILIRRGIPLNSFFTGLGAQGGDIIKNINGTDITLESIRMIIGQSFSWSPETEVTMVVERDGTEITLGGKAGEPTVMETMIKPDPEANAAQQAMRSFWLKPYQFRP